MSDLDLTVFFQTKIGAVDFSSRLAEISEQVYKSDFNLEKILLQEFGIQKKEMFLTMLRSNGIETDSSTPLKNFIASLQEEIAKLPVLSIKLAFEPTEQTLQTISEWFTINIKKQVLLDVTVDQNLIAGCDISYNGEYMNLSVKNKFDAIIKDLLTNASMEALKKSDVPPTNHHQSENFSLGR